MTLTEELRDHEYASGYSESFVLCFIAAQVKTLREQRGLSQDALAKKIGTHQPAVARIENCNNIPSLRTLLKLAEAFNLRVNVSFETFEDLPEQVAEFSLESLKR